MALLWKQSEHRSTFIGQDIDSTIPSYCHSMPEPNPLIVPMLEQLRFAGVARLRYLKVDHALVTALVERWRPETHTFHFPTGECTITLEDVALQLGLRVDGLPVVGPTMFDWEDMCETYLGIMPVKGESLVGSLLKLKWLRDNMLPLQEDPTEEKVHAYCRAYILGLIGGVLMPDKSGNKVHLMYLSLLTNLSRTRRYSWGSACLSVLYRELCKVTEVGTRTMGGCSSLLMSWAWYRMPYIAPISINPPSYPLVCRWSGERVLSFRNKPHNDLVGYKSMFDHIQANQFIWVPYEEYRESFPIEAYRDRHLWTSCTPIICFSVVEWHQSDRVKLQFRLFQDIPSPPNNIDHLHKIDMRGRQDENWALTHAEWIDMWNNRVELRLMGHPIQGLLFHTRDYMQWYMANSIYFLSMPPLLQDPRTSHQQRHRPSFNEPQTTPETNIIERRHSIANTSEDFYSNLFGVDFATPSSAHQYMETLYRPDFHYEPGSSSAAPQHDLAPQEFQPQVEEDEPAQPPRPPRRNPSRNRRRPRCGTGHHFGDQEN